VDKSVVSVFCTLADKKYVIVLLFSPRTLYLVERAGLTVIVESSAGNKVL
jgi:hypothetical protein